MWKIESTKKFKEKNTGKAILIEGLPGIGNVGKIAVDFLVDELKADRVYTIFSNSLPHSVFVNENNLIELPMIEIYHKKVNGQDVFLLSGDVQPMDEVSCYNFCESILDLMEKHGGKEIITTGGIGLNEIPAQPKVYCTSSEKKVLADYKKATNINSNLFGVVGPIVGVSGVMVGLASKRKMAGACLLAETYGHPLYVGVAGAKEIVKVISKKLNLKVDANKLDKSMQDVNSSFAKITDLRKLNKDLALKQDKTKHDVNYIG
ncbi:MAG: PAC2 family protein [Nanoarchaeota archaeon]|nr:PAC2 family protein [Nanoarchaeota archaeon]